VAVKAWVPVVRLRPWAVMRVLLLKYLVLRLLRARTLEWIRWQLLVAVGWIPRLAVA
jgi:hypothetical protein